MESISKAFQRGVKLGKSESCSWIVARERLFAEWGIENQVKLKNNNTCYFWLGWHIRDLTLGWNDRVGLPKHAKDNPVRLAWWLDYLVIGGIMENLANLMRVANLEAEKSKQLIEDLANKVRSINEVVQPMLIEMINETRSNRMAVVSEIQTSLKMLSDVRKFFLEKDYEVEMQRMERFISVCKEMQKLKSDGTLDVICDSALNLACGKEVNGNGGK